MSYKIQEKSVDQISIDIYKNFLLKQPTLKDYEEIMLVNPKIETFSSSNKSLVFFNEKIFMFFLKKILGEEHLEVPYFGDKTYFFEILLVDDYEYYGGYNVHRVGETYGMKSGKKHVYFNGDELADFIKPSELLKIL